METLGKLGFVYDVKHIAPNGEIVERQHFHNLMPDEGIRWALTKVFLPDTMTPKWSHRTYDDVPYRNYNKLYVNFFKGLFTMNKKFDSMATFYQQADELSESEATLGYGERFIVAGGGSDWNSGILDPTTNTLHFKEVVIEGFTQSTMLTGLFICAAHESMGANTPYGLLVSEAFFPKPMFVEKGGKITAKCGCALISE